MVTNHQYRESLGLISWVGGSMHRIVYVWLEQLYTCLRNALLWVDLSYVLPPPPPSPLDSPAAYCTAPVVCRFPPPCNFIMRTPHVCRPPQIWPLTPHGVHASPLPPPPPPPPP